MVETVQFQNLANQFFIDPASPNRVQFKIDVPASSTVNAILVAYVNGTPDTGTHVGQGASYSATTLVAPLNSSINL